MSDGADPTSNISTRGIAKHSSNRSIHTLTPIGADRLVLRSTRLVRGFSIAFLAIAAAILVGWAETNTLDEDKARIGRILTGGLFLLLGWGLWVAPQRVVFDLARDRMVRRNWFRTTCYSLKEVVAVQIINGGRHGSNRPAPNESRELNLVLSRPDEPRVNLTNHLDHAVTRSMAAEIARFLNVPLRDQFGHEATAPTADDKSARTPVPKLATRLGWCGRVCYLGAFAATFFCIVLALQQSGLDELDAAIQPVRARLVATEVKESVGGRNDWAAFGIFEIESGDFAGRAEGNLIPASFYTAHHIRRSNRDGGYSSIPRAKAETFLANWQIGQEYDGYIYPDARDHIFFELPGAEKNAQIVRNLAAAAGIFLTLRLLASISAAHIVRRRD